MLGLIVLAAAFGFSTQCSIKPDGYLVCLSTLNHTFALACEAGSLVVHVLHDDAHDRELARLFGEETADRTDKLSQSVWEHSDAGPVLAGCDWFAGSILDRVDLGDHVGSVIDVRGGEARRVDEPHLGLSAVRDLDAGHPA